MIEEYDAPSLLAFVAAAASYLTKMCNVHERADSCCRQTDRDVKGGVHEDVEDRPDGKIGPECEPVGSLFLSSLTIFQFDPEQRSLCSSSKTVVHPQVLRVLNHKEYSSKIMLVENNIQYLPMKMSPNTNY